MTWLRRLAVAAAVAVTTLVVGSVAGLDPEPLRVLLLALLLVTGVGLVIEALPRSEATWYPPPARAPLGQGRDLLTAAHLRSLEDHQRSRHPDAALRERLGRLTDQVLRTRHGVAVDSPEGRALLGPDLDAVLHGPVVRLTTRRATEVLRQIEEL